MTHRVPWSARHKKLSAKTKFNLSNSFAEPLTSDELIRLAEERGDQDIIDQYFSHSLGYTPNGGSLDLRTEIAALYGPAIGPGNIIVFTGAQVALQTAAMALLGKNDHAIVFTPGYQSTQVAPLIAGATVTRVELTPEEGWKINPEKVAAAVKENTKYMVFNEPYNPAGTLMSLKTQAALKNIAEKNDIIILSDEVYRLLEHNDNDRLPAMADFYKRGISAVTVSKPWGGCGITIGWLALQDMDLIERITDMQYFATACPSRASEIQAIMTLRASDYLLERNLKIIRNNVALLEAFINKYDDLFEWVKPTAGAICYMKFKGPLTSAELGEQLADEGISIKPAWVFSEEGTPDSGHFRVGYGENIMPKALEALESFVKDHKDEWRSNMRAAE